MASCIELLAQMTQDEFDGVSFNGEALMKTLDELTLAQITSKQTTEEYLVWEVALHLAYWKYHLTQKISAGNQAAEFPYEEKDWPSAPSALTEEAWAQTLETLRSLHAAYMQALSSLPEESLDEEWPEWKCSCRKALSWMSTHDLYHTAQIRNMGVPTE